MSDTPEGAGLEQAVEIFGVAEVAAAVAHNVNDYGIRIGLHVNHLGQELVERCCLIGRRHRRDADESNATVAGCVGARVEKIGTGATKSKHKA